VLNLRIVTPATAEPITLAEAKAYLKVDYDGDTDSPPVPFPDDGVITRMIVTARKHAQSYLELALVDEVYEWRIPCWWSGACPLRLPLAPVQSVDEITYLDTDGVEQTLATSVYRFDDNPSSPAIWLAYNQSWPSFRWQSDGIRITFTAGPDAGASPPPVLDEPIVTGMLLLIAHLDRNRDADDQLVDGMPTAVRNLWQPYRREMGV
jgi:uncharacterized phiE125 gp8 family phage protein